MNARSRWNTAIACGAGLALLLAARTHAAETVKAFHISAQPLASALVAFSEQSGLAVMAPAALVREKTASSVEGELPPLAALDRLMTGSGLIYSRSAEGITIAQAPEAPRAAPAARAPQKRAAPKAEAEVEEITVTAQRREENIQETPVSVTAVTGKVLEERGISDVITVTQVAPNLRINIVNSNMAVGMRGVAQGNPSNTLQSGVGLYMDGVYLSGVVGNNLDLEDIERVEVLRGPQGTLYGRNTIAGAVNFITRKPTDEIALTAVTEAGNYDYFKGRVTLNLPLIGKNGYLQTDALGTLSLRQTIMYKGHDGYFRNVSPTNVPASGSSKYNNENRIFNMTSLRWQPTKDLTIDYGFEFHRYDDRSTAQELTYVYPNSPASAGRPFDLTPYIRKNRVDSVGNNTICTRDMKCNQPLISRSNHRLHILTASYDAGEMGPLGKVTLKSISSYRSFPVEQTQDIDGSPVHAADLHSVVERETWSEELQWVGSAPRVNYVGGLYYFGERSTLDQDQVFLGGATNLLSLTTNKTQSYAPYGQVTYTPPVFNDRLSLTAGVRYTQEQIHVDRTSYCVTIISVVGGHPINVCNNPAIPTPSLKTWSAGHGKAFGGTDAISPMGNASFQWTDNLMTYFRIARGFKSGGFNGTTTDPRAFAIPFNPEKLLQYEAGIKSQWFDNRLRLNASGYYSDYTDLQESTFRASPDVGVLSIISNVDSAEIWGSEVEVTAIPLAGLELTGTYGLTLPKYLKWLDQKFDALNHPIFNPDGSPVLENVAKQRSFGFIPEHQATAGATYTAPPTASGTFSAHLDAYWQDRMSFLANNTSAGATAMEAPNYILVNGRLAFAGIPLARGTLDLAAFGYNLFDRKYRIQGVDFGGSLGWTVNTYGTPRTFGLQLIYNVAAS